MMHTHWQIEGTKILQINKNRYVITESQSYYFYKA